MDATRSNFLITRSCFHDVKPGKRIQINSLQENKWDQHATNIANKAVDIIIFIFSWIYLIYNII